MAKVQVGPKTALFPLPVVLVTCIDKAGKPNIITLSWTGIVCSDPPTLSISVRPHRYSYNLIKEQGEFVVNIATTEIMKEADICGTVSGRDVDKFNLTKLTPGKAKLVKPPLIKESPVSLECKVKNSMRLGTHEMFIGEILAVHIDESVMTSSGDVDYSKAKPFAYNQGEYWNMKEKVGFYGYTKKEE